MGDYYIYNGRLYSSDELMHFKLGFIKPGHKWITREKAPAGSKKNWIYTYASDVKKAYDSRFNRIDYAEEAGRDQARAASYDAKIAELEKEIQSKYGKSLSLSPAQVQDYKNKQERLAYYKKEQQKYKSRSSEYRKKAYQNASSKATAAAKKAELKLKVEAFLKHPFNKAERKKQIEKGKAFIKIQTLREEKSKVKRLLNEGNKYTKDALAANAAKRKADNEQKAEIKARKTAENARKLEQRKTKMANMKDFEKNNPKVAALNKNTNRIKGLNIQKHDETRTESMSKTNPHYNDNVDYQLYKQNCSNCSVAYDMRQRGYDVEANPNDNNDNYGKNDSIYEIATLYDGSNKPVGSYENLKWDDNTKLTLGGLKGGDGFTFKDETSNKVLQSAKEDKTVDEKYRTWEPFGTSTDRRAAAQHINNKTYLDNLEKEMLKGGNGSRGVFEVTWSSGGYARGGHSMAYEVYNGKVIIVDAQTNEKHSISDFYESTCCAGFIRLDNMQPTEDITKKVRNAS